MPSLRLGERGKWEMDNGRRTRMLEGRTIAAERGKVARAGGCGRDRLHDDAGGRSTNTAAANERAARLFGRLVLLLL